MLALTASTRVFVAVEPVDLRRSFDGLSAWVGSVLNEQVVEGGLFVFANRRRNRLKVLFWDGSGLWVCAKRLAEGSFAWPTTTDPGALRIAAEELALRLFGISLDQTRAREGWRKAA